MIGVDKKK